jgi:hypothetical protein
VIRFFSILLLGAAMVASASGQEPAQLANAEEKAEVLEAGGSWTAPPRDRPSWVSTATGLRFPLRFSDYEMRGVFSYEGAETDHIVRYESQPMRARGDVFILRSEADDSDAAAVRDAVNAAMVRVIDDILTAAERGLYDDLEDEGPLETSIDLWKKEPIPMFAQRLSATRIDRIDGKEVRTGVKIWYGTAQVSGHLVTIRHIRPSDTGEKGGDDMKFFVDAMLRVIKDPPLRAEMLTAFDSYLREPLTESGQEAGKLVLNYLDQSPMTPAMLPAPPLTTWADEMEKAIPNAGSQILRAFLIAGTRAALADQSDAECLTLACQQVARIYLEMKVRQPGLNHPGLDELTLAVERGEAASWLRARMNEAAREPKK